MLKLKSYIKFLLIILLFACKNTSKETIIAIQPIGKYKKELIKPLSQKIETFYGYKTIEFAPVEIPKSFFVNIKSPRYRADSIIRFLRANKPDSISYVLGITDYDISTTKRDENGNIKTPASKYTDWGIFGLGFRPGPSCVISSYRMGSNYELKIERAQKVALHELGHNLGLSHCPNTSCFMQDAAETIKTIDKVGFNLCEVCMSKI